MSAATAQDAYVGPAVLRRAGFGAARAVWFAVLTGAVAAGLGLGRQPLSWDEAVSVSAAEHRLPALAALLRHTDAPLGAYYLLLHGWLGIGRLVGLPATEAWVRLPSLLGALVAVGCTVALAARYLPPPAAAVAGVLLAVHPTFVFYAQDARPYALATAAVAGATLLFGRALDRPSPGRLAAYAGVAVLAVALHLFAALALLAHAVVAVRRGRPPGRWALTGAAVALAVAPLLAVSAGQAAEVSWIPAVTPAAVGSVLAHLYGGPALLAALLAVLLAYLASRRTELAGYLVPRAAGRPRGRAAPRPVLPAPRRRAPRSGHASRSVLAALRGSGHAPQWLLAALRGSGHVPRSVCSAVGRRGGRSGHAPPRPDRRPVRWAVPVGVAVLPPVLLVAADLVRPVLVARYLVMVLPATVLLVVAAAVRGGRVGRVLLAVAVVVAAVTTAVQQNRPYKYENFRAATDAVTDTARPGDGMLFLPLSSRVGYAAYAGGDHDGAVPADSLLRRAPALADRIGGEEVGPAQVPSRVHAARRIFLYGTDLAALSAHPHGADAAKVRALAGWRVRWTERFGAVSVALLTPPAR